MSRDDEGSERAGGIVVVGSLNIDFSLQVPRFPRAGETINGRELVIVPGGKGANQALACARLGSAVALIGCVGDDAYGQTCREALAADGVDVAAVTVEPGSTTGLAMILVDNEAQNCIALSAGANGRLGPAQVERASACIAGARLLIVQFETPLPAALSAIAIARRAGVPVLLNPAPVIDLPAALWRDIDCVVANEGEAEALTGMPVRDAASAALAARRIQSWGAPRVLVTLGPNGVLVASGDAVQHLPACAVDAVDTTAAGDTFIGGLATGLLEGLAIQAAAQLGQQAAAQCVTRVGAQPSIPYRRDLPPPPRR
jgi:ribokinase